jgi:hypothetical protein
MHGRRSGAAHELFKMAKALSVGVAIFLWKRQLFL